MGSRLVSFFLAGDDDDDDDDIPSPQPTPQPNDSTSPAAGEGSAVPGSDQAPNLLNQQSSGIDNPNGTGLVLPEIGNDFANPAGSLDFRLGNPQDFQFASAFGDFDKEFARDALDFYSLGVSIGGLSTGHTDLSGLYLPDTNTLAAGALGAAVGALIGFAAGTMIGGLPGGVAGADALLEPGFEIGVTVQEGIDDVLTRSAAVMGIEHETDAEDSRPVPTGFPTPSPNLWDEDRQQLSRLK
ncbi:hypothetical protein HDF12_001570 [Edaphobacter lichenicola]|uniref:Uncharacterized protein n=1 Tax=Tunturiibacter lichenicola TaxID=2051959 RepID=A0A7Y9NKS7_9BACT|nr:hypothetical protein [Edaphobacter lichenicola]